MLVLSLHSTTHKIFFDPDLFDWPIGITAKDDKTGKHKAAQQIEEAVDKLERDMGIPPSRIVVEMKERSPLLVACVCLDGSR
jgi:hypothetical protein